MCRSAGGARSRGPNMARDDVARVHRLPRSLGRLRADDREQQVLDLKAAVDFRSHHRVNA